MAAPTLAPPVAAPMGPDLSARRGRRSVTNAIFTTLMVLSFLVVVVPLAFVIGAVITRGVGSMSWSFLTDDLAISDRREGGGMGPAIIGTLLVTGWATVMAVPLGILGAVYLHEYGGTNRFTRLVRFMSYVMTGVPSIVMGLFIYVIWTLRFGLNGFGGALALGCLMLPVVIRSTEEMLRLVPDNLREASYALGSSKSRTINTVILPAALPGIVSGALLAVARAAGETAPLLFTIGASQSKNFNIFTGANTALATQIFGNAKSSFPTANDRAWGAALILVVIAFLFTLIARLVTARFALKR
jgi:phosphate transport system permease protein